MVLNIATTLSFCHSYLAHHTLHTEYQSYTIVVINKKYIYILSLHFGSCFALTLHYTVAFCSTFPKSGWRMYIVHLLVSLHCCFSISAGSSSIVYRFKYHLAFSPDLMMILGFSSILRAILMTSSSVRFWSSPCLPLRPSPFAG
jgi:hypothetical protein